MNAFKREPTGLAEDVVELLGIFAQAMEVSELESVLGRELTDAELEWIADGWEPASVMAEL